MYQSAEGADAGTGGDESGADDDIVDAEVVDEGSEADESPSA
jgi:hypothetical protein